MDSYTSYRSSQKVCTELRARCVAEGVVATHAEAIRRFPLNVSAPVINHHIDTMQGLLGRRAASREETVTPGRALYWAARQGHEQIVGRLLAAGADANQEHALYWAAREGHEQIVERLLVAGATGTDGMSTPRMRQLQAAVSAARSIRRKQLSLSEFNRPSVLDALPSEIVTDRIFPFV